MLAFILFDNEEEDEVDIKRFMSVRLGCWEDKQGRPGVVSSPVPANVSDDHIRMRGMLDVFFMKTVLIN